MTAKKCHILKITKNKMLSSADSNKIPSTADSKMLFPEDSKNSKE